MREVRGLVMAGGKGTRLARSGGPDVKPLLELRGLSLLERNLHALIRHGIVDVVVAIHHAADVLDQWIATRGRPLVEAAGGRLEVVREHVPLGTKGGLRLASGDTLVVVYADNFTGIDLAALVDRHHALDARMTVATHVWSWPIPFGIPERDGDWLVDYREKPALPVEVCSGVNVVDGSARELIAPDEAIGAAELTRRIRDRYGPQSVACAPHAAPWVDVNDLDRLAIAERMLDDHPELDRFAPRVDVAIAVARGAHGLVAGDPSSPVLVEADDVDVPTGRFVRARLHARAAASTPSGTGPPGARWTARFGVA